jgi:hypothetical protein
VYFIARGTVMCEEVEQRVRKIKLNRKELKTEEVEREPSTCDHTEGKQDDKRVPIYDVKQCRVAYQSSKRAAG